MQLTIVMKWGAIRFESVYNFMISNLIDGWYSSKFLRSSARRFLLEMLVRGKRYELARAGLVH